MFTNDYILRQIELLGKAAAKVFGKEIKEDGRKMETRFGDDADSLIHRLYDLVDDGKICEAEDELFHYAQQNPTAEVFGIAVEFYNMLGELTDDELARADFPREDISKGLSALIKLINE